MSQSDALTYRGAVIYAEFQDTHPHYHVEAPLRQNETYALTTAISGRGGMLVEASPRRLYGLFPSGDPALACARDVRNILAGARDSQSSRHNLGFRILLGYGMVTVTNGRLRSDWTFRLPQQTAQLPLNSLGATADFARHMGDKLAAWLQPVPGAADELQLLADPEGGAGVTRLASRLNLADAPVFSTVTLRVRGVPQVLRSSGCPITIGRDKNCGVVVSSDTASRVHGRIEFEHGKFMYVDQSRNGSYVLTAAGEELFLLDERIALVGEGAISPGAPLAQQTGEVVRYECQSSRLKMDEGDTEAGDTRPLRIQ